MRVLEGLCSSVKIILADGEYRGEIAKTIKKHLLTSLKQSLVHTKNKGSYLFINGGLLNALLHGSTITESYVEITFDPAEEMVKIAAIRFF